MEVRNHTPFSPMIFESRHKSGHQLQVAVLRGTFRIREETLLKPDPDQQPVVMTEQYYGEPGKTSVKFDTDIKHFKPYADIAVIGDAIAPAQDLSRSWLVDLLVGTLQKQLRVFGERYWNYNLIRGWHITTPELTDRVPLRYEHAFGGTHVWRKGEAAFDQNPVGKGFVKVMRADPTGRIPAPQIEHPDRPTRIFGKEYRPEGFGFIANFWQPRLAKAGTYDEAWIQEKWPVWPDDFHAGFHNAAHPDLVYPDFLDGNEVVAIKHMTPSGHLRFKLPGYQVFLLARFRDGVIKPLPMVLDTLVVDIPDNRVYLTWRFCFRKRKPLRVLEFRMEQAGEAHG